MESETVTAQAPPAYLLQLADNALILGQRNAEWCGHGPAPEEDIAMANISLDLIGQARMLYQYAAEIINATDPSEDGPRAFLRPSSEDHLAYFREASDFRNFVLLELPHHGPLAPTAAGQRDYACTIVRNFLYGALMVLLWEQLCESSDDRLAAIAAKALKESRYHLRHARDWLIRLGDGSDESHERMQQALDHLFPFCSEFWLPSSAESTAAANGSAIPAQQLQSAWNELVDAALQQATLTRPSSEGRLSRGKEGQHSEHLSYLLAEMQSVARAHPHASW